MEIYLYFRILRRKWWLVVLAFIVTIVPVLFLTLNQPPLYEAKATYVAKLSSSLQEDEKSLASALDILSRRVEIATTYAEVASSRRIRRLAAEKLGFPPGNLGGMAVNSRVLAGTNIIEITAQGTNNELVRDFANAVGEETRVYVQNLYETYELTALDEAITPRSSAQSSKVFNLGLGGLLGIAIGVGLAFLSEYFRKSSELEGFDIIDGKTGAYNERYFKMRLQQEMSRAGRSQSNFAVVSVAMNPQGSLEGKPRYMQREALRAAYTFIESQLKEEDIVARTGETTFSLLLPGMTNETAKQLTDDLRGKIALALLANNNINDVKDRPYLDSAAGIAAYHPNVGLEELIAQADRALEEAKRGVNGRVCLYSEIGLLKPSNGHAHG